LKITDLLKLYREEALIQTIAEIVKPNEDLSIQLKGLSGSLDAVVLSAIYSLNHQNYLVVLNDKEEAAYFHNDLQNLLSGKEILFFPTSYKKPYQFEDTENANILMRTEILNRINQKSPAGEIIITYPEALTEKVINKRSLLKNTRRVKVGESLDIEVLSNLLHNYDFEKTDFVFEAGQFAIRGGILDVFSYAHELPFRIEFFGNEIESIRNFDPNTQLSVRPFKEINILANVQKKLIYEERHSFLNFLPRNTKIWLKDLKHTTNIIENFFVKASQYFQNLINNSANTQVVFEPVSVFESSASFSKSLEGLVKIEFGNRFYQKKNLEFKFESEPQPSFNKNFDLLAEELDKNQVQNFKNIIVAESPQQIERLTTIFEEIDPYIHFHDINSSIRGGFKDRILKIACYTDHQIFERFHRFHLKEKFSKSKALSLKALNSLQPGDYVTHIDHGIGRFAGLKKVEIGGKLQESIRIVYKDDDLLYLSVHSLHKISKYSGKEGLRASQ